MTSYGVPETMGRKIGAQVPAITCNPKWLLPRGKYKQRAIPPFGKLL